jgi:hypothetical protein
MKPLVRRIQQLERACPRDGEPMTPEMLSSWFRQNNVDPTSTLIGWPDVVVLPAEEDLGCDIEAAP